MLERLQEFFASRFPEALIREDDFLGQASFYVKKEFSYDVLWALFNDGELQAKMLIDVCSLDWLGDEEEADGRFEVIYNIVSLKNNFRFFIKVRLSGDKPEIDSVASIWDSADWLEREVYDLMGINFIGHPNMVKIVTADDLEGHPLRKDFPLTYEVPQFSHNLTDPPEVIDEA